MRTKSLAIFAAGILAGVCFIGTVARSQDKPKDQPAAGGMDAAAMKSMEEAAAPGPQHKGLQAMEGKFKYTNKFKMDPSQDWIVSEGEYEGNMCLGGRYLTYTVKGPMMGMEFEGMGCLGYDNLLKKYVSGWIDNMGTSLLRAEGTASANGKTITFEGEMLDPMSKKPAKYKNVYEIKSADEFTMRMVAPSPDGKMFECMVIEFKREK
jgi:hypothetical protein